MKQYLCLTSCVFAVLIMAAVFGADQSTRANDGAGSDIRPDLTESDRHRAAAAVVPTTQFTRPERFEASSGGAGTFRNIVDANAFSHPSANIGFADEERFRLGNALFRKLWVSSPSSTQASDGLGPLFNARACQSCHLKDGRGHPPQGSADATSMLIRLARPAQTAKQEKAMLDHQILNAPDPVYGRQLQDKAVPGLKAEGRIQVEYTEMPILMQGGERASLRMPQYTIIDLAYGPLAEDTTLSPRIAPPMIGLGLIEAIHPQDIVAGADSEDTNSDGISGRVSMVRNLQTGTLEIGRFGWKASQPSLKSQNAAAFSGDIGISTSQQPLPHGDCTRAQPDCLSLPTGVQPRLGETEASDAVLELVTFYSANLAVPARRDVGSAGILKGKELFYRAGCTSCHTPKFVTRRDSRISAHAFQLIWPYSDFLLHDMGPDLADRQQVGDADGQEWRTPPLWGIGLTQTVNRHSYFLHDGRARNLTEAILWHGGEAQSARDVFAGYEESDRAALVLFLQSL